MTEESKGSKFLGRLKEATSTVVEKTREGVEDLQQKQELSKTYGELGRTTADLVESGAISHPELTPLVDRIRELKAALEAESAGAPSETPAES